MKISVLFKSLFLACAGLAGSVYGQVYVSFSGGNGSPLSVTLDAPVSFTVTQNGTYAPLFVLGGTDVAPLSSRGAQYMTYSINGSGYFVVDMLEAGLELNDVMGGDLYFYASGFLSTVVTGDVVSLEAATFITADAVAAVASANGTYDFFITDGEGNKIGTGVSAIPEPSTYAVIAGALMLGVTFVVRRRKA